MAVTITHLAGGHDASSEPYTTSSLTWTSGTRGVICVATAAAADCSAHAASGGGVTWTQLVHVAYGGRRGLAILVSDGTPSNGTLTINPTVDSYSDSWYGVAEVAGFDSGSWPTTGTSVQSDVDTGLNVPDVGTIDTGDMVIVAGGFGIANATGDSYAFTAGITEIYRGEDEGFNVRSLMIGKTTSDDTPGATWTTATSSALVAALFKASGGGGGGASGRDLMLMGVGT